ncbi:AAA family ATPase [Paramicrobacterium sp. CJ85]|uniref:AAA family ATPase n=1 Tax=Paramicrobacterium sp. CJ85 TaxID=3445355 RepID=UPI003F6103AA
MATIWVGTGWGRMDASSAIQSAAPGDVLIFDPGQHDIGNFILSSLTLQGSEAGPVVVTGKARVAGHCRFTDLELRSLPYNNAVAFTAADAFATLTRCTVVGDPAVKFPAIWHEHGTLVLDHVIIQNDPELHGLQVAEGARVHATASQLGRVWVKGGHADLVDSSADQLELLSSARVNAYGTLTITPPPGKRLFTASGQSVFEIAQLRLGDEYAEAYANDSMIRITAVAQGGDGSFTIMTEDDARVHAPDGQVTVRDANAPAKPVPEPESTSTPKVVLWPLAQAHEFKSMIIPQLSVGDTVLLEEGDYYLSEYENDFMLLNASLVGQGRSERTVIHGTLGPTPGGSLTVRNVTIRPTVTTQNAVNVTVEDGAVALHNVVLGRLPETEVPSLYAKDARVELRDCTVTADPGDAENSVRIAGSSATLTATECELGFFAATDGATATINGSTSYSLVADGGSAVTVSDRHTLRENTGGFYGLTVYEGSRLTVPELAGVGETTCALVDNGSLTIGMLSGGAPSSLTVHRVGNADLDLADVAHDLYTVSEDGELTPVHEVEHATASSHSTTGDTTSDAGTAAPNSPDGDALAELNSLIGLENVKQKVQSFINTATLRRRRAELGLPADDGFTLHSMFLGNPGTGKTSVARLVGKALHQAGVIASEKYVEAKRADLVSENIGGTAQKTRAVLESALGGVLFIDEAYSLAAQDSAGFAEEAVTEIIAFMEDHRDDLMVIFAGYTDKMHELLSVNEGMRSRIKHRFDFEDYTADEIAQIGLRELRRAQYTVNEELYTRIVATAYTQGASGANGRWIRNFNQDLRSKLDERVIAIPDPTREDLTTILDSDLHALAGGDPADRAAKVEELLAELDAMIGLEPVKRWVRSVVNQVKVAQRMLEHDGSAKRPTYHMAFLGNPGTGKTTVARIVAGLFHALGILDSPTVKQTKPTSLVGQYIGHTEKNTHLAFDEAMGGVMFIDEAHQLNSTNGRNDFGVKVIQAMIPRLEDDRHRFVAIFAGYTDPMRQLYEADPGLKSRIPFEIEFPDYTTAEVVEIAARALSQQWVFDRSLFDEIATAAYDALPEQDRSNGRWARNFTERIISAHTDYLAENDIHGEAMKQIPDEVLRTVTR